MTENKRFELKVNQRNQCDIVDWVESKEKNAVCIYNDLGNYYFSSAKALCELLNNLNDENRKLLRDCDNLIDDNTELVVELNQDSKKLKELQEENDKLKKSINEYAFISDCSVQVLNEEEDVKDDYLALSCKELHKLKKENEELKFDKQQLHRAMSRKEVRYKEFRDKVFDLIDEKIKELKNINNVSIIPRESIEVLEDLKRELKK